MPIAKRAQSSADGGLVPYWQSECGRAVVFVGDNLRVMMHMPPSIFHAVCTDPPYGLEFMGKEWDAPWKANGGVDARERRADELGDPTKAKYLRHNVEYNRDSKAYQQWFWDRCVQLLRVAKPGAHLLSFGGTRMWHRMACAIEDAGFEVRDTLAWVYGSGFPKGQDVSKAIDKLLGAERAVVGRSQAGLGAGQFTQEAGTDGGYGFKCDYDVTEPATEVARQWVGWNTALKPAFEPIIIARRPPHGSVAANMLEHGCGGVNVDGCRIGTEGGTKAVDGSDPSYTNKVYGHGMGGCPADPDYKAGRWPANLLHDGSPEVIDSLPEGAARYFYCAKADAHDRVQMSGAESAHPTVKPLDLMRYLVRLVCARGGSVLDPFMGSGSTGVAAIEEGTYFVGIEQGEDYARIAVDRLKVALGEHPHLVKRLDSGKVAVVDRTPPPPRKLR